MKESNKSFEKRYLILSAVMTGCIMASLDGSIVNVMLPTISESLGADIALAQWVPMSYLLTMSSLLLFNGRLGDILGYRKVFLFGLGGFVIASVLCAISPTIQWLIAFRAIQGLTGSMMMAVPYAIIAAAFPPKERGKALGIYAISISSGLALGPSVGGFITASTGWRYAFFINVPIGIAAFFWGRHIIPKVRGEPAKIDKSGAVTAFVALFSILLFINRLQGSGLTYANVALLFMAVIAGIVFFRVESKAIQPMLNLNLFRNATFSLANFSALLNFMSQYIMVFVTPFYLQRVLRYAPDSVGLIMTAFPVCVMITAPFSGALSDRIGTRPLTCLGAGTCAVSLFFMSQLSITAGPADIMWRLALFGLGTGMFQSPNTSKAMGSVPKPHLGVASGTLATMRNVGMVLGIATAGAILYTFSPLHILQKATLESSEAALFVIGSKYAYIAGGILTALAMFGSLVKGKKPKEPFSRLEPDNASGPRS